jgi:predicted kinase
MDDIVIFDCIEFSESLRYCDVASELGFLAMDLEFLGAPLMADELVRSYESLWQDAMPSSLLRFYKCYRAYVRGKVEGLKSQESEVPERERATAATQATRYFALSYRYAKGAPAPALIVVCGLAGTGKSTLARTIRDQTGFPLFQSDAARKRLAGFKPTERTAAAFRTGIYSDAFTDLTYESLRAAAEASLKEGKGAIVDATFKDSRHRRLLVDLAGRIGVPILFVECRADEEEVLRRLERRARDPEEVSDASREIYLRQRDEFMPLTEIPDECRLVMKTDANWVDGLERLDQFLS